MTCFPASRLKKRSWIATSSSARSARATGNIVTEDLVFLLEAAGFRTGIDIGKLIAARAILAEALPGEPLYGHVPEAGLPKGFLPAARMADRGRPSVSAP